MKAIQVRYMSATNTKPSRVKAMAEGVPSITLPFSYDESPYALAAQTLADKYNWGKVKHAGTIPNGDEIFSLGP